MRSLFVAFVCLALFGGRAAAQTAQAGDAQAGKTLWEGPATQCRNCHGEKGQGAFGPDLAGRHLSVAQFRQAVRKPWGVMPAFIEAQITDREVADLVAYFDTLPSAAQPGPWRFEVPADAARGQATALATVGCAQCHGPILNGPRADAGAVAADFEWFKKMVYEHTASMPPHWVALGERPPVRTRMGNFSRARVPEPVLQEIFTWAKDLGFRAKMAGTLSAAKSAGNGVTYALDVENVGIAGKGLTAEDLTIALVVPAGATVVSTTGAGYKGVRQDADLKAQVAVWELSKIAPHTHQAYSITLSRAGTPADNVRGAIRWTKPAVKTGPVDQANIAPAPIAPQTN
jgi:mono/diheme cytochrome c family protein